MNKEKYTSPEIEVNLFKASKNIAAVDVSDDNNGRIPSNWNLDILLP